MSLVSDEFFIAVRLYRDVKISIIQSHASPLLTYHPFSNSGVFPKCFSLNSVTKKFMIF